MKFDLKKDLKRLLVVCLASVLMALNIKSFVRTGGLYPGGATGLSLLIQRGAQMYLGLALPYTVINVILNAIPIYIGFRFIGKKFTLYSCLCIVLTSVLTDLIPGIAITSDVLLISIFGGIINGFAISLCLLTGSTTGGTDFISIYLSEKKGMDAFNIILGLNAVILGCRRIYVWMGQGTLLHPLPVCIYTGAAHSVQKIPAGDIFHCHQSWRTGISGDPKSYQSRCHHSGWRRTLLQHTERQVVYSVVSSAESKKVRKVVKEAI